VQVAAAAPAAPAAEAAAAAAAAEGLKVVDVDLGDRSYPIYIGPQLLDDGARLRQHIPGSRVLIVTNTTIAPLYLQRCVCGSAWRRGVRLGARADAHTPVWPLARSATQSCLL
jgi:hypothetical protein